MLAVNQLLKKTQCQENLLDILFTSNTKKEFVNNAKPVFNSNIIEKNNGKCLKLTKSNYLYKSLQQNDIKESNKSFKQSEGNLIIPQVIQIKSKSVYEQCS